MNGTALILVAGGRGVRFGGDRPKTLMDLDGQPVFVRALVAFRGLVDRVVLVAPAGREEEMASLAAGAMDGVEVTSGGPRRQDAVLRGLRLLDADARWILIHDAARPLVDRETIVAVLEATRQHGAAVPVVPVQSTVKAIDANHRVVRTVPRDDLRLAQTPQGFRRDLLDTVIARTANEDRAVTDEAALFEAAGRPVMTVPGSVANRKITTADDLAWAAAWLRAGRPAER